MNLRTSMAYTIFSQTLLDTLIPILQISLTEGLKAKANMNKISQTRTALKRAKVPKSQLKLNTKLLDQVLLMTTAINESIDNLFALDRNIELNTQKYSLLEILEDNVYSKDGTRGKVFAHLFILSFSELQKESRRYFPESPTKDLNEFIIDCFKINPTLKTYLGFRKDTIIEKDHIRHKIKSLETFACQNPIP